MSRWTGRALVVALGILLALQMLNVGHSWQTMSRVSTPRGSVAPDVTLPLLDGGTLHVAAERGHPLVLAFWASWCGPCMAELPGVDRVAKKLNSGGHRTHLFAINTEGSREAAGETKLRLGLSLPIALDDGSGAQLYRVNTIPHIVILDGAGRVATVLRGMHREDELMSAIESIEAAEAGEAGENKR